MSDVFISYSRIDSAKALELAEKLRAEGVSVWVDQHGISGASQWATSIAEAIRNCSSFILLLSPSSVQSPNVLKEVSLASEKRKKILPVDISPTELPVSFEYPLAGIQRVAYTDYEAISAALKGKMVFPTTRRDGKKTLMVLPFQDLSPTQDNAWFADGLMSELVGSLSQIKSLRLIDQKTSLEYRNVKLKTTEIARDLSVRYFIEGSVRKFGDQIKVSVQLLDIEEGEYLWQTSHKGVFEDIFNIQEEVARKVVDGLKLTITKEEETRILNIPTKNAHAYELYLRGVALYERQLRESTLNAFKTFEECEALDPTFAVARRTHAYALVAYYRVYDRSEHYLEKAEQLAREALATKPDLWSSYGVLSYVDRMRGNLKSAEENALIFAQKEPLNYASRFGLGFFYANANQLEKAASEYIEAAKLRPDDLPVYWNLVIAYDRLGNQEQRKFWSTEALPHYERRLRLEPDDETARVYYANFLFNIGEVESARTALAPLLTKENLDPASLYNIACLYLHFQDTSNALTCLRRAIDCGLANVDVFQTDPDLDPLRPLPEFQHLLERIESKATSGARAAA